MITEEIKIPTDGRPIEAFTLSPSKKPNRAFLIFPGKYYTINYFLLDFIWKMAAEAGFFAVKTEYRGYTYRHLDEPFELNNASEDIRHTINYLTGIGYQPEDITVCAKSLGTMALANFLTNSDLFFKKVVLLTPILYFKKDSPVIPFWEEYKKKVSSSYLVFGGADPYCDMETASSQFPTAPIDCYPGANHVMDLDGEYRRTIAIQTEIIEKVKEFIIG